MSFTNDKQCGKKEESQVNIIIFCKLIIYEYYINVYDLNALFIH